MRMVEGLQDGCECAIPVDSMEVVGGRVWVIVESLTAYIMTKEEILAHLKWLVSLGFVMVRRKGKGKGLLNRT